MSSAESYIEYREYVRHLCEPLGEHSDNQGLLRRPFSDDDAVTFSQRLQGQIVCAETYRQAELVQESLKRLGKHYVNLYFRQQLFIASQYIVVPEPKTNTDAMQILHAQEFYNATVVGVLRPFKSFIVEDKPQITMNLGEACVRYIEEDCFENENKPDGLVSVPVAHIEAYSFQPSIEPNNK